MGSTYGHCNSEGLWVWHYIINPKGKGMHAYAPRESAYECMAYGPGKKGCSSPPTHMSNAFFNNFVIDQQSLAHY